MSNAISAKSKYNDKVKAELASELGIKNVMAIPTITKIVINSGIGKEAVNHPAVTEEMLKELTTITGQKPVITKSKKAISNFKLRADMDNGLKVTLRGDRMWDFYDKLVNVVLPRIKDFRGVPRKAFDTRGNYALGIKEHTVFPEIDTSKMVKIRGLQVIICTSAQNDAAAEKLLEKMGMPFKKDHKHQ